MSPILAEKVPAGPLRGRRGGAPGHRPGRRDGAARRLRARRAGHPARRGHRQLRAGHPVRGRDPARPARPHRRPDRHRHGHGGRGRAALGDRQGAAGGRSRHLDVPVHQDVDHRRLRRRRQRGHRLDRAPHDVRRVRGVRDGRADGRVGRAVHGHRRRSRAVHPHLRRDRRARRGRGAHRPGARLDGRLRHVRLVRRAGGGAAGDGRSRPVAAAGLRRRARAGADAARLDRAGPAVLQPAGDRRVRHPRPGVRRRHRGGRFDARGARRLRRDRSAVGHVLQPPGLLPAARPSRR